MNFLSYHEVIILNIKQTIDYLKEFDITMTAAGLRAAIRRGYISGAEQTSEKGEIQLPVSSILDYALNKTNNKFSIYRAGFESAKERYEKNLIVHDLDSKYRKSFLFEASHTDHYHYLVNNFNKGFSRFYLKMDWEHAIIHLKCDVSEGGTLAVNQASEFLILDILSKLNDEVTEEAVKNTKLFIYIDSSNGDSKKVNLLSYGFHGKDEKWDFGVLDDEKMSNLIYREFMKIGR